MAKYRVVAGCPCGEQIAPYIELLRRESGCTINSIYRGQDAAAILHRHDKHTQAELYSTLPAGTANPAGRSSHELRSDGRAFRGPVGRRLDWWEQGFDVNDDDIAAVKRAAKKYGWEVYQPYPGGVEFHHLNFRRKPVARTRRTRLRLIYLRRRLGTR
jgi:hypothetical protein